MYTCTQGWRRTLVRKDMHKTGASLVRLLLASSKTFCPFLFLSLSARLLLYATRPRRQEAETTGQTNFCRVLSRRIEYAAANLLPLEFALTNFNHRRDSHLFFVFSFLILMTDYLGSYSRSMPLGKIWKIHIRTSCRRGLNFKM